MKTNLTALPQGTILNKRYKITDFAGIGGFSLTYLSERIEDGEIVFIKELYNSDYMDRISPEKEVHFDNEASSSRFEQDMQRFQREREFMTIFKSYPEMLSLLDYFEENNTAYIVTEYLPGGTLKEIISNNGPYPAETLFELMENVISLLSIMHTFGYVHGDISPDNIVMDQNGKYRLVDFGAVKEIGIINSSHTQLRKKNYTPAEIFNRHYRVNTRSDIYSLCAVYYYSLSGTAPEDSFERILIDEVPPLSNLLPDIDPIISNMIMKGISLNPEYRWGSIKELQNILIDFYRSEEEKKSIFEKEKKRKKKKRIILGAAASCLALTFILIVYVTHRDYFYFKGKETQTIVFYYSETISPSEINKLYDDIGRRISIWTGNNKYLLKKGDGFIEAIVEKDSMPNEKTAHFLDKYFRYSCFRLGSKDTGILINTAEVTTDSIEPISEDTGIFITAAELTTDSIESIKEVEDGIIIILTEDINNKLKSQIPKTQHMLLQFRLRESSMYTWDRQNIPQDMNDENIYEFPIKCDYDSRQIFISKQNLGDKIDKDLFIDCLLNGTLPINAFNYERKIIWEKKDATWGKNQVELSGLRGDKVLLDYINPSPSKTYDKKILQIELEEYEIEYDDKIMPLKHRLDALGIPYACGWDESNEYELYFAFEADSIWEIEAALLFEPLDCKMLSSTGQVLYDQRIDSSSYVDDPFIFTDGKINILLNHPLDNYQSNANMKDNTIQLCLNGYPVFQSKATDTNESLQLSFDEPVITNLNKKTIHRDIERFVNFTNSLYTDIFYGPYSYIGTMYLDSWNHFNWKKDKWSMYGCESTELRTSIQSLFSSETIFVDCPISDLSWVNILCDNYDLIKEQYSHPFAIAAKLLNNIVLTNEVNDITISIFDREDYFITGSLTEYQFSISKNENTGNTDLSWDIIYFESNKGINQETFRNIQEKNKVRAMDYLKSEKIFSQYSITPPLDVH